MNTTNLVEFLRFGSSIPGDYWGCCAGDIIQCFKSMPDELATCQSVNGDGGYPQKNAAGEDLFFGVTNHELFLSRLRVGTFGTGDMVNHFFLVVLEHHQLHSKIGQAWLPILKENGFEFIRTQDNSVWTKTNYIFGLFRNSGGHSIPDQFTPPKVWRDLPSNGKTELWEFIAEKVTDISGIGTEVTLSPTELTEQYRAVDKAIWDKIGPAKLYTEAQIIAMNEDRQKNGQPQIPIILAGLRSENPQEYKTTREQRQAASQKAPEVSLKAPPTPVVG